MVVHSLSHINLWALFSNWYSLSFGTSHEHRNLHWQSYSWLPQSSLDITIPILLIHIFELKAWSPYLLQSFHIYASPSSGEAYRDRQLTTNFEFWVEIFCVPTCFHKRIPKPCLSVCPSVCLSVHLSVPREKKPPYLRQYQSYIDNWYINGKVFTSTTPWEP